MEFSELIKVKKVNGVLFHEPFFEPHLVTMCITVHHIKFTPYTNTYLEDCVSKTNCHMFEYHHLFDPSRERQLPFDEYIYFQLTQLHYVKLFHIQVDIF